MLIQLPEQEPSSPAVAEGLDPNGELAASISLLDATLESAPDGVLALHLDPPGVSFNRKFASLWNVPQNLLAAPDREKILAWVGSQSKDPEGFARRLREHQAQPDVESSHVLELKNDRAFEYHAKPRRVGPKCVGVILNFRDVTERKHAEAVLAYERDLLNTMLDNLPDAIYFKDLQSRFVRFSKSYLCLLNTADPEAVRGKTDFDLFAEAHARPAFEDEQEIIRTGQPIVSKLEKETHFDGHVTWALTTKVPWRDEAGNIIGTFGTSKDVTAMKEAEGKLESVHKQLLEASRQAGMAEVATSVLHNVGNVLNSVNTSAGVITDLVRSSRADGVAKVAALLEEHRDHLSEFLAQGGRAAQVVTYLKALDQQRLSEQATVLKELAELNRNIEHIKEIVAMQQSYAKVSGMIETQSLSALVEDALRMHGGGLDRHHVRVIRQYEPMPDIPMEKHKVLQILVNLISNAKYSLSASPAEPRILTIGVRLQGDGLARISIADNGIGIAPENLTRIFAHGFTTKKDGHGFGLHSGALAAREMGGALRADSQGLDKGATFTLELPVPLSGKSA